MPETKNGGLESHYDMISEVDGVPVDKEARAKARAKVNVTDRSFDYKGEDNEWNCTVYFKDDDPFRINFYVWSAKTPVMVAALEKDLGYPISMTMETGGNGHYSAVLTRKVEG